MQKRVGYLRNYIRNISIDILDCLVKIFYLGHPDLMTSPDPVRIPCVKNQPMATAKLKKGILRNVSTHHAQINCNLSIQSLRPYLSSRLSKRVGISVVFCLPRPHELVPWAFSAYRKLPDIWLGLFGAAQLVMSASRRRTCWKAQCGSVYSLSTHCTIQCSLPLIFAFVTTDDKQPDCFVFWTYVQMSRY